MSKSIPGHISRSNYYSNVGRGNALPDSPKNNQKNLQSLLENKFIGASQVKEDKRMEAMKERLHKKLEKKREQEELQQRNTDGVNASITLTGILMNHH